MKVKIFCEYPNGDTHTYENYQNDNISLFDILDFYCIDSGFAYKLY